MDGIESDIEDTPKKGSQYRTKIEKRLIEPCTLKEDPKEEPKKPVAKKPKIRYEKETILN